MKKILVLNGPNLNMLGQREPEIYGHATLADIETLCHETAKRLGLEVDFRQSNHEGEMIGWVQESRDRIAGLIINAAGYTHTSVALHDALKLLDVPVIEVHLSDPKKREEFRRFSFIESLAAAVFSGQGAKGYVMAVEKMAKMIENGAGRED